MRKIIYILSAGIVIFVVLILFFLPSILQSMKQSSSSKNKPPVITPFILSSSPIPNAPESTNLIPKNLPSAGGGVDTSAASTQTSINEIKKINPLLPYSQQIQLSTGKTVDIFISDSNINSRPWVLPIFIGGIDYAIPENNPRYVQERADFREAVIKTFEVLKKQNVDTSLIFVNWGDKAYIQERAEDWLK